ncbi:unnamed protein product [Tilletia laevis]|uniref:Uncharacterized protein n=3 Tax=Tilletia TaxID=13289 RepID=A0A9N8Q9A0_9BASI|nr:unnamed protein product [Tilletia caries]CAD6898654.1 unnamed protein product [Tilletia controversa]CAD6898657.1 unnamed protein product [Tilletia controversa]CAD6912056.1 unnamed protein product [Tilletia laevis]CAD6934276.1 unnamed protein product [Tilletia controversa]
MKFTLASTLALVGAAAAATEGPYSIGAAPAGTEVGILNSTLLCNVSSTGLNLKNQQILFGVAAQLPNRVGLNQPFFVTAATRLIVPASINNLAYGFGARTYAGNATKVIVNAKGSTPSFVDAAATPLAIPSAPVVSGGVSILNVPAIGQSLTVGPFKGATANSNIVFSFGDINAIVKTYNSTGGATFLTANITCPSQARPASLAYVAVGATTNTATVTPPAVASIPTIPINSTAGLTGYTYNCTFTGVGSTAVNVSLGGVKASNAPVASGSTIALSQGQGNIFSSQALVNLIKAKYSTATAFSLAVSTLNFNAVNATPSSKNGLPSTQTSPIQALAANAVVGIPSTAPTTPLPDVTFTAGASGSTALLSLGSAAGSLTVYNSANTALATVAFSCPALSPAVPIFPFDIQ